MHSVARTTNWRTQSLEATTRRLTTGPSGRRAYRHWTLLQVADGALSRVRTVQKEQPSAWGGRGQLRRGPRTQMLAREMVYPEALSSTRSPVAFGSASRRAVVPARTRSILPRATATDCWRCCNRRPLRPNCVPFSRGRPPPRRRPRRRVRGTARDPRRTGAQL